MSVKNALEQVMDQWSNYDYKDSFRAIRAPYTSPQYIPEEDERRLRAYAMLEAYFRNASRHWLKTLISGEGTGAINDPETKSRREYGEPSVLVNTALSSLIGNQARIVTEGAIDGAQEGEEANPFAVEIQQLIEQWADMEKFTLKYIENERQSVKLGDSIYALGWDSATGRPRLNVYDPGFYFPVFDPRAGGSEDFPTKVHLCWEFEEKDADGETKPYVRRITWELIPMNAPYAIKYDAEDTMATTNCLYEDGIWELSEIGKDLSEFLDKQVDWITEPVLLDLDFIPVVHMPNTINLQGHYGESILANVLQILDDIIATDSDVQANAATTGSPPIVVAGRGAGASQVTSYGPGTIIYVGDGSATIMDTSTSLDALLKLKDALLSRLSINSRTPEALLGRVKPSEVPSGIALTLGFTPHIGLIKEMRLVRSNKYPILFKFVVRLFQQAGIVKRGAIPLTQLVFGSFLPADKQETMTLVMNLLSAKAISTETAVQMLIEAGYPIEDWITEIDRIQSRDWDAATQIMTITGDPNRGLDYLGMEHTDITDQLDAEVPPPA